MGIHITRFFVAVLRLQIGSSISWQLSFMFAVSRFLSCMSFSSRVKGRHVQRAQRE